MATTQENFMDLIELHERSWGMQTYPGRPSLVALLAGPVVVLWEGDRPLVTSSRRNATSAAMPEHGRFMLSVHQHVDELNGLLYDMLVVGKAQPKDKRRLARIFVEQKEVRIKGLRLLLAE
ncbi:MAG: hypothetical protein IT323_22315 [Anaerolineae bacterium]|nr:hypothetical protein [Anaerolineae bacterium]